MLGELNEQERERVLQQLLADQGLSDEMKDLENDFIDALAAGRLSPAEAAAVERHLRSTGQWDRLGFANAMGRPRGPANSIFAYALALAAMVFAGFGIYFQAQRGFRPASVPAIYALTPGALRDETSVAKVVKSPAGARLQLLYEDVTPSGECRIVLRTTYDLDAVTTPCGTSFQEYFLPAQRPEGRYTIELATAAGEVIHLYHFDYVPAN